MAKTGKKKAPSRVRYERDNPTVSCRVTREIYDRLKVIKEIEGKSFADVLKTGLNTHEVKIRKAAPMRKKVYDEGYAQGYTAALNRFKVVYPCNVCGEMLTVTTADEKKAVKQYMREHGWGHGKCHQESR